jgi:spermidine synthase
MIKKYILEITVFVSGAFVMIYELVGARVLGPFFGTSMFIWTALIGIVLGSLSLGYYLGGKLADKQPKLRVLALILVYSSITIVIAFLIKDFLLIFLSKNILDIRLSATISSLILFAPTSVFLGMISPYAVKLKLESLSSSGQTVGSLYAISTLGSIFGTFLAGFYLIPFFGTNQLLFALPGILILLAIVILFLNKEKKIIRNISIFLFFIIIFSIFNFWQKYDGIIDIDTSYNRIWIYERDDLNSDRKVRIMGINNENHSAMFLDSEDLVNEYTNYYRLAEFLKPDFHKTLMLGGAGYSFPKYYLNNYLDKEIDVVEIDPKVTKLAHKYFRLEDNSRLNIYHQDARVYLNNNQKQYDVIFGDAFGSRYSVPYQLSTVEAIRKKYEALVEDGVVILNLISALEGEGAWFAHSQYLSYSQVFEQVFLFPVTNFENIDLVQNIMLIALKSKKEINWAEINDDLQKYASNLYKLDDNNLYGLVLTDNYAPVDYYMAKVLRWN